MEKFVNIALLIDAENITSKHLKNILESLASYGTISVRRIYADWTSDNMKSWKEIIQSYSLIPIQQFPSIKGKNATDSAMIIDAMDLVHETIFDCFALVSSDSDFSRLAQRIREKGKYVIGYGEEKTPVSFRNSCNDFVVVRKIDEDKTNIIQEENNEEEEIERLINKGIENNSNEDGWVHLGFLGNYLKKIRPDFNIEIFGDKKLLDYFKRKNDDFEIHRKNQEGPGPVYIRKRN